MKSENLARAKHAKALCLISLLALILLAPPLIAQESGVRTYYQQGVDAFSNQNYYDAAENFKLALRANPNYTDALLGLAQAYFYLGEYQEALNQIALYEKFTNSITSSTLKGRAYAALGQKDNALALFQAVLSKEPNNLDAQFGMAEINLLTGRTSIAIRDIANLLTLVPDNRRALLSLCVLYDDQQKYSLAESYIKQALFYYPQDTMVLYMAGKHYELTSQWPDALEYFNAVYSLNPNYADVIERRAFVLLGLKRYDETITALEDLIRGKERTNAYVWTTLAQVFLLQGEQTKSLQCFDEALRLAPNDELIRFSVENFVQTLPYDAPERKAYAQGRIKRGNIAQRNFDYSKALREYRWALLIDPISADVRFAYAQQLQLSGMHFSFLDQLRFLKIHNTATQHMLDILESEERRNVINYAQKWGLSNGPKSQGINLFLATIDEESQLDRPATTDLLMDLVGRYMERFTRFNLKQYSHASNFTDVWRQAREENSDFFVTLAFITRDRSFYVSYKLYLTSTGSLVSSFSSTRSSESKIDESLKIISEEIDKTLPVRAKILRRDNAMALIDLGALNGIQIDDEFIVLKASSGRFISNAPLFEYLSQDELGQAKVEHVDEYVSEVSLSSSLPNDIIAQEDLLFLVRESANSPVATRPVQGIPQGFLLIH